jgi:hypothetical protein
MVAILSDYDHMRAKKFCARIALFLIKVGQMSTNIMVKAVKHFKTIEA